MMAEQRNLSKIEAQLKGFRQIADVCLQDIIADERMVAQVRAVILEQKPPKSRKGLAVYAAAAACIMVMLFSGTYILAPYFNQTSAPSGDGGLRLFGNPGATSTPNPLLASASENAFGEQLPYGIAKIHDYSEGYAVALGTNQLYGYVNMDGKWVVEAIYEQALPVENGIATVTLNGETQVLSIP